MLPQRQKAFTLIELLIVISLIAVLAVVSYSVINFQRHLGEARNTRRQVDLHAISFTVWQYFLDSGQLPSQITTTETELCKLGADCTGLVDLSGIFSTTRYLSAFPTDSKCASSNSTCYTIQRLAGDKIRVTAPLAENEKSIFVIR